MKKSHWQKGFSTLLLVFIIAFLLTVYLLGAQLLSLADSRRVSQVRYTQKAFFAAEGAVYETIEHLRQDLGWPDFANCPEPRINDDGQQECLDSYQIGDNKIYRVVTDLGEGTIGIDITATVKNTKRRIVAEYGRPQTAKQRLPIDIVMVLDRSGSMDGSPLAAALDAARFFVSIIEAENAGDRIGLISYSLSATNDQNLTDNYSLVYDAIDNISATGRTNLGEAVEFAGQEMTANSDNETKIIIVLSDGVANVDQNDLNCLPWPCQIEGSIYGPDNLGNICTDYPITESAGAKGAPLMATVYSILLNNITNSSCSDIQDTEDLGRLTLLRASSEDSDRPLPGATDSYTYYKETSDEDELADIFGLIAEQITTPESFEIEERLPQPED